jgi:hypothetical protein
MAEGEVMKPHPIQPTYLTDTGVLRFKPNAIVRHLLDNGPFDMNKIAILDFSREDQEQFAQLIGYSLSGFGDLSYVSNEVFEAADAMSSDESLGELQARNNYLREKIKALQEQMRDPVAMLYDIHPDDLTD